MIYLANFIRRHRKVLTERREREESRSGMGAKSCTSHCSVRPASVAVSMLTGVSLSKDSTGLQYSTCYMSSAEGVEW